MDWNALRAEFPALGQWTYLNTANYGQIPARSVAAATAHFAHRNELACTDFLDWFDRLDALRASLARLIGADSGDDIAFVPTTAAALSIVMAGLNLAPDENVVTVDNEFPNYQYMAAARKVPADEESGQFPRALFDAVDEKTRLIAVSQANYSTGIRAPLEELSRFASDRGIPLFLDGTQSLGGLTIDLRKTPVSVLAVHGYKWLLSPSGAGFMYVSPEMRARLPPNVIGWRSHYNWREVDNFHTGSPQFPKEALKYEGGGLPYSLLFAMQASVDWILELGPAAIEQRTLELASHARASLRQLGATVHDTGSHLVAARFPGIDAPRMVRDLKERRVLIAARNGNLRVAPYFYNTEEEIDRLRDAVRELS